MKITKTYLKEIILEELKRLQEGLSSSRYWALRNIGRGTNRQPKPDEDAKDKPDKDAKDKESENSDEKNKK